MSSRSKGNKNERRAELLLQKSGYKTQRCGYRKFKQNDFFGLFDILAIKSNESCLIQVKSNSKPGKKLFSEIQEFFNKYNQFTCEVWVWVDRKGWRKWIVDFEGWKEIMR